MNGRLYARKDAGGGGATPTRNPLPLSRYVHTPNRKSVVALSPVPYIVGQLLCEHIYTQGIQVS